MIIEVHGHIESAVEHIGTIETLPAYEEQFTYSESFMAKHPYSQLSLSLPHQEEPFASRQTRPYFKNLLPEGAALDAIARRLEVNSTSYLQILGKLGDECIVRVPPAPWVGRIDPYPEDRQSAIRAAQRK